jgi:lipopolysaccharide transport system ATP-binding protein
MSDLAIRADRISKKYKIGAQVQTYRTLRESLVDYLGRSFHAKRSKDGNKPYQSTIWALRDVSFEVRQGEVIGILGRNGAGKSTLLKVLSRITRPTSGEARLRGRVGSLLEVGTGFHPELTGRENIFLNGAILGMRRDEIESNFEKIVDFAEIGPFLNTPVKRYSSGMYMRLAFAVAAHMEPEVLMIDEVLAVGDAAFQKKCLGKMGEFAGEGRTVLFVSHNLGAIQSLCQRSILLSEGILIEDGPSSKVIKNYLKLCGSKADISGMVTWSEDSAPGCPEIKLLSAKISNVNGVVGDQFDVNEPIQIEFTYRVYMLVRGMRLIVVVNTQEGVLVFASTDHDQHTPEDLPGTYVCRVNIPPGLLNRSQYSIQIIGDIPGFRTLIPGNDILHFSCIGNTPHGSYYPENWPGVVAPKLDWCLERFE